MGTPVELVDFPRLAIQAILFPPAADLLAGSEQPAMPLHLEVDQPVHCVGDGVVLRHTEGAAFRAHLLGFCEVASNEIAFGIEATLTNAAAHCSHSSASIS